MIPESERFDPIKPKQDNEADPPWRGANGPKEVRKPKSEPVVQAAQDGAEAVLVD